MALDRTGRRPVRFTSLGILIPFLAGVVFLAGAVALAVPSIAFVARAVRTQAVFVGSVTRIGGSHGGSFHHPEFRFQTSDGRSFVVSSHFGSTDQPYATGDTVPVLYDPEDPDRSEIDSILELWLTPLALAIVGLGLTWVPAIVWLASR